MWTGSRPTPPTDISASLTIERGRVLAVSLLFILNLTPALASDQAAGAPVSRSDGKNKSSVARRAGRVLSEEVRRYGSDAAAMARAPLSWDASRWQRAAIVGGVIATAFAADPSIADAVQRSRSETTDGFSRIVTPFGARRALNISAAVLLVGVARRNPDLRDAGRDAVEASILAGGIITPFMKRAVGRSRPIRERGAYEFDPFSSNQSFPSGHATNAFAVASVFAAHSRGWIVPTLAYTLATGVAVSRMNDNVHYSSDVLAGAVIGTMTGRAIVARHRRKSKAGAITWQVVPSGRRGILVQVSLPQNSFHHLRRRLVRGES